MLSIAPFISPGHPALLLFYFFPISQIYTWQSKNLHLLLSLRFSLSCEHGQWQVYSTLSDCVAAVPFSWITYSWLVQGFETLGFDDRDIIAVSGSQPEELCLLLLTGTGKKMNYFKIECSTCFSGFLTWGKQATLVNVIFVPSVWEKTSCQAVCGKQWTFQKLTWCPLKRKWQLLQLSEFFPQCKKKKHN